MSQAYSVIDFIFTSIADVFRLVVGNWGTSLIFLVSLLSLVIKLYLTARQDNDK